MRFLVESYGCALNRGEADEFTDGMLERGHEQVSIPREAEAFAIFTCGVIETTERHMLRRITELAVWPEKPLLVCGCLSRISPAKIIAAASRAMLFGPAEHMEALESLVGCGNRTPGARSAHVGILPIATGCRGSCTYCITRAARGHLRSRPLVEARERLEALVAGGAAEIQLCAQDTAVYGTEAGTDLAALVRALEEVPGDFMMRIGMMSPAGVMANMDAVLEAYASPRVFKFLHLPVQSGSDEILQGMGRRHTAVDFTSIVRALRERFPRMVLSTDIIVGFPGETDADFRASMELMREVAPDIINVTRFSPRPGTEAQVMDRQVPGRVAKARSGEMSRLKFEINASNYRRFKGITVRVLATERRKPGTTFLRTTDYRPVVVMGELEMGRWHHVRITGRARTHLRGVVEGHR